MKKHHVLGLLLSIPLAITLTLQPFDTAFAQSDNKNSSTQNRGALYYLGDQDELLMRVNIWGFVQQPGQYMVPKDTDLISLISFAGGPREEAKIKKIKLIRNSTRSQSNAGWGDQKFAMNGSSMAPSSASATNPSEADLNKLADENKVFEVDVKKYIKTGDKNLIPELKPGDTIVVEGSTFHFVTKALDFTAKLAVFVNVYYLIQIANNR